MALLRHETGPRAARWGWVLMMACGALAATLVALGNPGNMGICGACFLRDVSGSLGLLGESPASIFRPEIAGVMLGALVLALATRRFDARSGSQAATRFFFGALMGIGALVFLGCPFRLLQRLGGGDLSALAGALGLVLGVGGGVAFERRGLGIGRTQRVSNAVGLLGPVSFALLLVLYFQSALQGPGPSETKVPPAHAPWAFSLSIALIAGALLSATGFCTISAARQVFGGKKAMLVGALCLIAAYGVVSALTGRFSASLTGQPAAHSDQVWNALSMALVGLCGVLAGGCPVRQVVMAGEGNGDAFVTTIGILLGGALATNFGLVSTAAGPTAPGRIVVAAGLAAALAFAALSRQPRSA